MLRNESWVRITIDDDAWNGTDASGCGHSLQHEVDVECENKATGPGDAWGQNRKDYLIKWHGTREEVRTQNGFTANSPEEKAYWKNWERACPYVRNGACCDWDAPEEYGGCCGDSSPNSSLLLEGLTSPPVPTSSPSSSLAPTPDYTLCYTENVVILVDMDGANVMLPEGAVEIERAFDDFVSFHVNQLWVEGSTLSMLSVFYRDLTDALACDRRMDVAANPPLVYTALCDDGYARVGIFVDLDINSAHAAVCESPSDTSVFETAYYLEISCARIQCENSVAPSIAPSVSPSIIPSALPTVEPTSSPPERCT